MSDKRSVEWNCEQIRILLNKFEGKRLPDWVVGGIEGYLGNILRITERLPEGQKSL